MLTVARGRWWSWAVGLAVVGLAVAAWGLLARPSAMADEGGGEPQDQEEAVVSIDLDTDTNNNGSIDGYEDEYEEYPSGRVVCLDRKGDGESLDDLGLIVLTPPDTDEGTVKLEAIEGGSLIKVWRDENKSVEVVLPATWSPAETPGQLYVDGIALGQVVLKLSHTPPEGEGMEDSVALYVTDTISWAPAGNLLTSWAPCYDWSLMPMGVTVIADQVKDHGWETETCFFKDTSGDDNDCEDCTLAHFKIMKGGGIVAAQSHGMPLFFFAVFFNDEQAAMDWYHCGQPDEEPFMAHGVEQRTGKWAVAVISPWFEANWMSELDERKSIVNIMSCYSAKRGETMESVLWSAGGRTGFGYMGEETDDDHARNSHGLYALLCGTISTGFRTTGKAYKEGLTWEGDFVMIGQDWTTLNPAPNAVFPAGPVGGRKGAGCIIFDTYMDEAHLPNMAVQKTVGGPVVSDRRWFANGSGRYLVSFDFDSHVAGGITMKGEADFCKNKKETTIGYTRKLSGDRRIYGSDWPWSF